MSPNGPLAFPTREAGDEHAPPPRNYVVKQVRFRAASVRPPARVDLFLVVDYREADVPVTVSGYYHPMLHGEHRWRDTSGDRIRGRVIAWAPQPIVTEEELHALDE